MIGLYHNRICDSHSLLRTYSRHGFSDRSPVYFVEQAFSGDARVLQALRNEEIKDIGSKRYAKAIEDGLLVRNNSGIAHLMRIFGFDRPTPRFRSLEFLAA